ncbi:MAG: xylulokinase, partial [Caulobacterales bacterium]|nr:xylulokinase [Caulobacterales bacterium]
LRAETAEAWGMDRAPVVAGAGDNAAGAAGVGVTDDGEALLSLGTSGVIFLATREFRPFTERAVHAFCHALPERWHQMSVMLSAASCLEWAAQLTGAASIGDLIARAESVGRIGARELFLPYLSGERTPHNNPHASGVLFGLGFESGPAAIAEAVLEGVALGLADGMAALRASGAEPRTVSVIGGGARSLYWGRIIAAAMNETLIYRDGAATGPALGAARLARYGVDGGAVEEVFAPPRVTDIVEPRESDIAVLAEKRERHAALYQRLITQFEPGNKHV